MTQMQALASDRFVMQLPLSNEFENAVSFRYSKNPEYFLRCRGERCFIEKQKRSKNFERECSFIPLLHLWFEGYITFESAIRAGAYLRMPDEGRLQLDSYENTDAFKKECSFRLTHPSGMCLLESY